jgi:hypothetical protein
MSLRDRSDKKLEGIVSIGDLARRGAVGDVVEDVSKAEPNG